MRNLLIPFFCVCVFLLPLTHAHASDIQNFQTPTGNIQCATWDESGLSIRCDIGQMENDPPAQPPRDCEEGDWGNSFYLEESGQGKMICVFDSVANEDAYVLRYGQSFTHGAMTCTSQRDGLTCANADGGGFFLSKRRQETW